MKGGYGENMASSNTSIRGATPISYIANGRQVFIPLGFVTLVDENVEVDMTALTAAGITDINKAKLEDRIKALLDSGELAKSATPPPQAAFALNAKQPGRAGNQIRATVKQNPPATSSDPATFDLTIRVNNFTEYDSSFGGLFHSSTLPIYLPYAVQQFFLNGGTDAYIVGLQSNGATAGNATAQNTTLTDAIVFTALEITETGPIPETHPIQIRIRSGATPAEPYDVELTYRDLTEVFRGVLSSPGTLPTDPNHIETRINGNSALVTVSDPAGGYQIPQQYGYNGSAVLEITSGTAGTPAGTISNDFADEPTGSGIFALEQIPLFNLLCMPGISDTTTIDRALIFVERRRAFAILDSAPPPQSPRSETEDPSGVQAQFNALPKNANGAFYYPWLRATDTINGVTRSFPPCGNGTPPAILTVTGDAPDLFSRLDQDYALSVYLYHAEEVAHRKNLPAPSGNTPPVRFREMGLNLHYLLAARGGSQADTRAYEREQRLMGIALKAFHDFPILDANTQIGTGPDPLVFPAALRSEPDELRLVLRPATQPVPVLMPQTDVGPFQPVWIQTTESDFTFTLPGETTSRMVTSSPALAAQISVASKFISHRFDLMR